MTRLLTAAQASDLLAVPPSWLLREARADRVPPFVSAGTFALIPRNVSPGGGRAPKGRFPENAKPGPRANKPGLAAPGRRRCTRRFRRTAT
jgi:hypothetical protein